MTVVELLEWGKSALKEQTEPKFQTLASPTLDAEVLLAYALDVTKPQLFSRLNFEVSPKQEETYRAAIAQRLEHEPVAYITGKKYFYGRAFEVNRNVLIPRPETETLIEEALRVFKLYEEHREKVRFIDVGTGSGALGITLSAETHKSVIASDISPDALVMARKNAATHKVADQMTFAQGNLLEPIVIILEETRPDHQPEIRDFEPRLALEAGYYGLDVYWLFFRQLKEYRRCFGGSCVVLCEIDPAQDTKLPHLIREHFPEADMEILPDLHALPRVIRAVL
ncbi:MAG: Release factor glutamine methyltransferase [Candidatus Uhrbacteria bacterium GW2011_GWC2_53_7]|uniref:Release factor glutamine methyltransferase n=1 Tax=Candidatus Uhrbacteria bacterium GW2011_GWC2_53_7 TaxID=1618986 RepID=A0A0G2A706_9BACT|nr:MAG: Release factor glutamine methyltransferase [Candidatus Uhrbacteria bacterium GW2011_GWC2_53_7]